LKVGLILPLFSGDASRVLAFAEEAEAAGFDGLFAFDHLFSRRERGPSLEAFATLGAVAASTRRVSIGTLVTRPGLRSVPVLAKIVATLQEMSGGRFILGIGTGDDDSRAEQETFGLPFEGSPEERLATARETVRALRSLLETGRWRGSDRVAPASGPLVPRPKRPVPIWVGGASQHIARVAGELADSWNGWGLSTEVFAARLAEARRSASERGRSIEASWAGLVLVGRDASEVERLLEDRRSRGMDGSEIWAGDAPSLVTHLDGFSGIGADWAILMLAGPPDRLALVADSVLPGIAR
jgi:alkanesulfonate monooxygenase SsuD/methylene tetrahydromethanopterin reductase-like flavin-dependent oxidoreductase (luciferase family)